MVSRVFKVPERARPKVSTFNSLCYSFETEEAIARWGKTMMQRTPTATLLRRFLTADPSPSSPVSSSSYGSVYGAPAVVRRTMIGTFGLQGMIILYGTTVRYGKAGYVESGDTANPNATDINGNVYGEGFAQREGAHAAGPFRACEPVHVCDDLSLQLTTTTHSTRISTS